MKTLANCTIGEFMPQAYRTREAFHRLYHAIDIDGMRERLANAMGGADDAAKKEAEARFKADLWQKLMCEHCTEMLDVVAACAFLTPDEAAALKPSEAMQIITECISDSSVMSFFISAERLVGDNTGAILPMLILIAVSASGEDTSQTQSQSNATETGAENSALNTSESA